MDSTDPADFESYLEQFPNGVFRSLAQNRLRAIAKTTQTGPAGTVPAAARARPERGYEAARALQPLSRSTIFQTAITPLIPYQFSQVLENRVFSLDGRSCRYLAVVSAIGLRNVRAPLNLSWTSACSQCRNPRRASLRKIGLAGEASAADGQVALSFNVWDVRLALA